MGDKWIKDIAVGALPEPFDQIANAMEADLREALPKRQKDLAPRLAHICMLSILAECEGEEIYFPKHDGDKLCVLRHDLIRRDFKKLKMTNKNPIRAVTKKYGVATRTIRNVLKGDHEDQGELFDEDG